MNVPSVDIKHEMRMINRNIEKTVSDFNSIPSEALSSSDGHHVAAYVEHLEDRYCELASELAKRWFGT